MNTFSPVALCGRADLIRARAAGQLSETAALLGYQRQARRPEAPTDYAPATAEPAEPPAPAAGDAPLAPVVFWRPESYVAIESIDPAAPPSEVDTLEPASGDAAPGELPPAPGLQPPGAFADLLPGLRRAAAVARPSQAPDIRRLVRRVGRGEVAVDLPRLARRRWGERLSVITDASPHLVTYREDFRALLADLRRLAPRGAVETRPWRGPIRPAPPPGAVVIALTDLGALADPAQGPMADWAIFGRDLVRAGRRPVAILPAIPAAGLGDLTRWWIVTGWERPPGPDDPARDQAADLAALRALAAPAIRIEPGLLRGLRLILGADAALDAAFWQSAYVAEPHDVAATPDPQARRDAMAAFAALPRQTRARVLALLKHWHAHDLPGVWREEVFALDADSQSILSGGELDALVAGFAQEADRMLTAPPLGSLSWCLRMTARMPEGPWGPPPDDDRGGGIRRHALRRALTRAWAAAHQGSDTQPPPGYDPALLPRSLAPRRRHAIRQHGDALIIAPEGEADAALGVPLATIDARRDDFAIEPVSDFWKSGTPPPWADAWGCDGFGPWVEFSVPGADGSAVVQRMRWIPAGRFLMGSPEDEPERDDDEGPRHEVTISRGFWLFDTACPQRLWRVVMGENPSQFWGDDRPVETVSWHDCVAFLGRLNARVPGLDLVLPSEAQWEYACRAGTETPFSFGLNIDPRQVNYAGVTPYKGAREGLFREETVPLGSLPSNAFGIFEMHGNVLEWCADGMRGYGDEPVTNPLGPTEDGASRVLRGGSWRYAARCCRSAYRSQFGPDDRYSLIGFRCARVQDGAEPERARRIPEAKRRIAASPAGGGGDRTERLNAGGSNARCALPVTSAFVIRSDCEHLTLAPVTRPPWAAAMGRDRYGLWTRFEIERPDGPPVAQRMRWIPPGSFMMGSPEDEPERYDREGPRHPVTLERGFWLFDTACPQALWTAVMGRNPSRFAEDDRNPVERVSWNEAMGFIARINALRPGLDLSLPSEAQWEYACRAGATTPFSFGANVTPEQVNYDGNYPYAGAKEGLYREKTVPVASLPANAWGLHEMHGNVWEWCADVYHPHYDGAPDDGGPRLENQTEGEARRVLRGGSWFNFARDVRAACRRRGDRVDRNGNAGFRCARVQA